MTAADGPKAEIDAMIAIEEEIDVLTRQILRKLDDLKGRALVLGIQESGDSNVRPVIMMVESASRDYETAEAGLADVRGRLQDWRRKF